MVVNAYHQKKIVLVITRLVKLGSSCHRVRVHLIYSSCMNYSRHQDYKSGMNFFSYLTDFSYFLSKLFSENFLVAAIFQWFQLFYFLTRITPDKCFESQFQLKYRFPTNAKTVKSQFYNVGKTNLSTSKIKSDVLGLWVKSKQTGHLLHKSQGLILEGCIHITKLPFVEDCLLRPEKLILKNSDLLTRFMHRRSWHGPPPFFLTFCLQIYFQ
jgi:hypothetical protein